MIGAFTANWAKINSLAFTYEKEMQSTSDFIKTSYDKLKDPHIVICDHQTKGRGRGDNLWQASPEGHALYASIFLRSRKSYSALCSPKIGLNLYLALNESFPTKNFSLKAPNDIYLDNKKLAGILLEGIQDEWHNLFIGIGINVLSNPKQENATNLDENMSEDAWHLFLSCFWKKISSCDLSAPALNPQEIFNLEQALKKYDTEILSITDFGDINYSDKSLSWREL